MPPEVNHRGRYYTSFTSPGHPFDGIDSPNKNEVEGLSGRQEQSSGLRVWL